jgi:hypothetical protein
MKERKATIPAIGKDRLPEALERLVRLYEETGKHAEAAKRRTELDILRDQQRAEREP